MQWKEHESQPYPPETLHISTTTLLKHQLTSLVSSSSFNSDSCSFSECILDLISPLHLIQTKCVGNHLYNTLDQVFSLTLHHHSDSVFVTRKNNNQPSWHITSPSEKLISKAQTAIEKKYEKIHERWKHDNGRMSRSRLYLENYYPVVYHPRLQYCCMEPKTAQGIADHYLKDLKFALHSKRVMMTAFDYKLRYLYGKCVEKGEVIPSDVISTRWYYLIDIGKLLQNICAGDILRETMDCFKRIYVHSKKSKDTQLVEIISKYRYLPLCTACSGILN